MNYIEEAVKKKDYAAVGLLCIAQEMSKLSMSLQGFSESFERSVESLRNGKREDGMNQFGSLSALVESVEKHTEQLELSSHVLADAIENI